MTVVVLLVVIMSKKMNPVVALIVIPIIFGLIGGFGFELPKFILEGIKSIAPTGTSSYLQFYFLVY